jgi:signal transduction histidine kinase
MALRILFVDDEPADCEVGADALTRLGDPPGPVDVVWADDWPTARQHIDDGFDLILLDFHMPRMNGLEVLQELRDRPHPPVVMITGQDDIATAVATLRAGAYDYVPKSVDWGLTLCLTIKRVVERMQLESQIAKARRAIAAHAADLEEKVETRTEMLRAQAEQIEKLYLRAEEAARLKDEIVDNTSHELRTPLNAIIGFTSMLDEELPADTSDHAREMLQAVRESSRQLLQLVESVLQLGDLRNGRVGTSIARFALSDLVNELRSEAEVLNRGKKLRLDWPDPLPTSLVEHDREKIRVIAYHLLTNAFKFTNSGSVGLSLRETRGGGIHLRVTDTGRGFPPGARATIFEDFQQLDGSHTRQYGGLGLGLGIVKRYATLLGGTVQVDGSPGKGTTITVDLPAAQLPSREPTYLAGSA